MLHIATLFYSIALFAGLATLPVALADTWGPAYSLGPTSTSIIEAYTVFNPGTPPSPTQDYLFLWPGISNATSGLIQSGADAIADQETYCGATEEQWCVSASRFGSDGQTSGDLVPVDANTNITIHYLLGCDGITWNQTVTVGGEVISTLTSTDGPLIEGGWGTGTECQSSCTGTGSAQFYYDTKITMSAEAPEFDQTLGKGDGVIATDLYTNDGGLTWQVDSIEIPKYTAST
ncbi:uncharacterized protein STEHIDRAFT_117738 [Stereum hirsutum FP-91666 SS1]|uniref:uncharacterized protein n=1 Tax=Stereum hirsutum (strain FP-91666) TaxID=721885 RepID=UPI000440E453|nr:uncharacterized protein STEHIDRAFT_117738 [Stereum hirsutum FP-91666 SS1]EIM92772.1 hypothetical protein STEHIDRAFT_117738 [Stereum hirsutum FP-91666 SS1]